MRDLIEKEPERFRDQPELGGRSETPALRMPWAERIESFRPGPSNRGVATWTEHLDINGIMTATGFAPEGCLTV